MKYDSEQLIRLPEMTGDLKKQFRDEAEILAVEIFEGSAGDVPSILAELGLNEQKLLCDEKAAAILNIPMVKVYRSDMSHAEISGFRIGVTVPAAAIARTGTLAEVNQAKGDRRISLIPEVHIALVREKDILPDLASFLAGFGTDKNITLITGPSRTADIEKRIVIGAHGPKRLIIVMLK